MKTDFSHEKLDVYQDAMSVKHRKNTAQDRQSAFDYDQDYDYEYRSGVPFRNSGGAEAPV